MSMRAALLVMLAGTSGAALGCKDKYRPPDSEQIPPLRNGSAFAADGSGADRTGAGAVGSSPSEGSSATSGSAASAGTADPAAAGLALALPAEIGPPPPFDKLRRYQKRSDVLASLGASIREASGTERRELDERKALLPAWMFADHGDPIYSTPIPGVLARLSYEGNRLQEIALISANGTWLETAVTTRWGTGDTRTPGTHEYPASSVGWSATLTVTSALAELVLTVAEIPAIEHTPDAPGLFKMFADVGSLIGEPLAAGERVFGDAFVIESADDEGAVAERSEAQQGYADVTLPWTGSEWTTVLRVDQKTGKVVQATIDGETDEYEERVELMKQLKAAFGKPQTIITDAGYQRIGFSTTTLVITLTDHDPHWTIEMHRR